MISHSHSSHLLRILQFSWERLGNDIPKIEFINESSTYMDTITERPAKLRCDVAPHESCKFISKLIYLISALLKNQNSRNFSEYTRVLFFLSTDQLDSSHTPLDHFININTICCFVNCAYRKKRPKITI